MEDYFSTYLLSMEALLHIENYSEFQFAHMHTDLGLLRSASAHDLKTVSLSFLVTSFDAIFSDSLIC